MLTGWVDSLLAGIKTLNQMLTAGIAITAFSLLIYALTFNLRDRVARSQCLDLPRQRLGKPYVVRRW